MASTTENKDYVPEWVKVLRQAILDSEKEGGAGKPTDKTESVFCTPSQKFGGGKNGMDRLEQVQ